MRFVAVKSVEKQASGMAFKTRDLLVRQRTQTINALRGHMAEYGVVAPNGTVPVARLVEALEVPDNGLPAPVIALCQMLFAHIASPLGTDPGCSRGSFASGHVATKPPRD